MIEQIEGRPELAEAAVENQRKAGHVSEYLFAARSQQEFERKRDAIPLLQRQKESTWNREDEGLLGLINRP